jgi:hypothetical protein
MQVRAMTAGVEAFEIGAMDAEWQNEMRWRALKRVWWRTR